MRHFKGITAASTSQKEIDTAGLIFLEIWLSVMGFILLESKN